MEEKRYIRMIKRKRRESQERMKKNWEEKGIEKSFKARRGIHSSTFCFFLFQANYSKVLDWDVK